MLLAFGGATFAPNLLIDMSGPTNLAPGVPGNWVHASPGTHGGTPRRTHRPEGHPAIWIRIRIQHLNLDPHQIVIDIQNHDAKCGWSVSESIPGHPGIGRSRRVSHRGSPPYPAPHRKGGGGKGAGGYGCFLRQSKVFGRFRPAGELMSTLE